MRDEVVRSEVKKARANGAVNTEPHTSDLAPHCSFGMPIFMKSTDSSG